MTLIVRYRVLFVGKLKAIKNILDSLIYLSFSNSHTQALNFGLLCAPLYIRFFFKIYYQSFNYLAGFSPQNQLILTFFLWAKSLCELNIILNQTIFSISILKLKLYQKSQAQLQLGSHIFCYISPLI